MLPAFSLAESDPPVRGQRAHDLRLRTKTDQVARPGHGHGKLVVFGKAGPPLRRLLEDKECVGAPAPAEKDWKAESMEAQGPDVVLQETCQAGNGTNGS